MFVYGTIMWISWIIFNQSVGRRGIWFPHGQNMILITVLQKCVMTWTKEILKTFKEELLMLTRQESVTEEFGLHQFMVRQIVCKWRTCNTTVTLPRSGRATKIIPRTDCEVAKNARETSRKLKAFVEVANINVQEFTTRKTLNNNDVHSRVARRKPWLPQK